MSGTIELMVELPTRDEAFEKRDSDGIEIGLGSPGVMSVLRSLAQRVENRDRFEWVWDRQDTPFPSAEQDSDMRASRFITRGGMEFPSTGWSMAAKRMTPWQHDNDAATRQIGDDFVLVALPKQEAEKKAEKSSREMEGTER